VAILPFFFTGRISRVSGPVSTIRYVTHWNHLRCARSLASHIAPDATSCPEPGTPPRAVGLQFTLPAIAPVMVYVPLLVRHRRPKGPVTDMPSLKPPRNISTLQTWLNTGHRRRPRPVSAVFQCVPSRSPGRDSGLGRPDTTFDRPSAAVKGSGSPVPQPTELLACENRPRGLFLQR